MVTLELAEPSSVCFFQARYYFLAPAREGVGVVEREDTVAKRHGPMRGWRPVQLLWKVKVECPVVVRKVLENRNIVIPPLLRSRMGENPEGKV